MTTAISTILDGQAHPAQARGRQPHGRTCCAAGSSQKPTMHGYRHNVILHPGRFTNMECDVGPETCHEIRSIARVPPAITITNRRINIPAEYCKARIPWQRQKRPQNTGNRPGSKRNVATSGNSGAFHQQRRTHTTTGQSYQERRKVDVGSGSNILPMAAGVILRHSLLNQGTQKVQLQHGTPPVGEPRRPRR